MTSRFDHDAHCRCRLCQLVRVTAVVAFFTLAVASCELFNSASPKAASYAAELQDCVAKNESRAGADACADDVKRRYGRQDGGRHE